MYIIDFLKNLGKKSNIGVIIWLILNAAIVTFVMAAILESIIYGLPDWAAFLLGFLVYFASLAISLSPVGEFVLRLQNGCKKIDDPVVLNRLEPLFNNVFSKASFITPNLNRNIQFFISEDESPNAFATGRNTVCITRGLMNLSDSEIEGALAHEFGHLAHKDTDTILVISVGNMIVTAIMMIIRIIGRIFSFFSTLLVSIVGDSRILTWLSIGIGKLGDLIFAGFMWLWTELGVLLCLVASRANEYLADEYAYNLNLGNELCSALEKLGGSGSKGLWAALNSSHPDTGKRIERLHQLQYGHIAPTGK